MIMKSLCETWCRYNGVGARAILLACHHQTTAQSAPLRAGGGPRGLQCSVDDVLMEVAGRRGKARCHGKEDMR